MCGILFELLYQGRSIIKDEEILQRINNRGPDGSRKVKLDIGNGTKATFYGTVLWMQGPEMKPQPVENEHGILLYNGDIFDEAWDKTVSDTHLIMERLNKYDNDQRIVQELNLLKGPFSIIYYNKITHNLVFARDRIGRNSLLFKKDSDSIVISSVLGRKYKCIEIPATHIFILNLATEEISLYQCTNGSEEAETFCLDEWLISLQEKQCLPDDKFSIQIQQFRELDEQNEIIKYIEAAAQEIKCKQKLMSKILENQIIYKIVTKITELLQESVRIRLNTQPQKCIQCLHKATTCNHCTVGILFSGGLDCTILAFIADKYLNKDQSIELLNVAFKKEINGSYDVPDRLTGKQSFEELKSLCPSRKWIFKEINVPKEELELFQKSIIADLVYPRQTILDESLGSALWFAARGQDTNSVSSCRVLLLGSGADELFGGYTRHRNAFKRHGWTGLRQELYLDWSRISFRNLARDNRVICDHGRQPRMPYLDEDFTNFVLKLEPWLKCFPSEALGQGVGDKLLLRLLAFKLGLTEVVTLPKRALQFGSRIANNKEKGSDISKRFTDIQINH